MKPSILIRADGSAAIGLGHIVRCLSLAHMLKNDCTIQFFVKKPDAFVIKMIEEQGFDCEPIDGEALFLQALKKDSLVILDGYHFKTTFQKKIKSIAASLVCIDDLHEIHFVADFVINHAPGVDNKIYSADLSTKFLLGPDYALLRPAFLNKNSKPQKKKYPIKKIIICFGGSDFKDLTSKILSWIPDGNFKITIITGAAYPYAEKLNQLIDTQKHLSVTLLKALSAIEMRNVFNENDLAIVPASGILFEAIAVGIPVITGYYTENQLDIYRGFLAKEVVFDAKGFSQNDFRTAIKKALVSDTTQMLKQQKECIDGYSPQRIREKILSLC